MSLFKPGLVIFEKGETINGLYIVFGGLVKEFVKGHDGKIEIIRFVGPGKALSGTGFDNETYQISAMAHEETVICFFENQTLYKLYLSNPKICFDLMLYFSNEFNEVTFRIKCLSYMNLREKIAEGLLQLADSFGINEKGEISDMFNREDLANLVGTTTQQVSRQLSDFENENLIVKRGRKLVVQNMDKLRSITRG